MEQYGSYEVIRELTSARGSVVYLARKKEAGVAAADGFIVKTFSSAESVGDDTQIWRRREHEGVPLIERVYADADAFLDAVRKQQRTHSEGSLHVAPVLGFGKEERRAWYATKFYPRSIKRVIEGRVNLSAGGFFNIIRSITRGLLDFKRTCGQSHGNLKPSNVLIAGRGKIRQAGIVLIDPAPDKPGEHLAYEIADLHAIGEIMYQLTRRKEVAGRAHWPLLPSPEWSNLFGDAADAWRELCNKLLDPELSVHPMNLEELEAELVKLEPKPLISIRALATIAAAVLLVCVGSYFLISHFAAGKYGAVKITSAPTGAQVLLDGQAVGSTPYEAKNIVPGELNYLLKLEDYNDYRIKTNITAKTTVKLHSVLSRQTGTVVLTSDPSGAQILTNGIVSGKTPSTLTLFTGTHTLILRYPGLKEQKAVVPVENQQTKLHLVEFPRGSIRVMSDPSGATVLLDESPVGKTPADLLVNPGPVNLKLQLDGYNDAIIKTNITNKGNPTISVTLLEGQGRVDIRSKPPGAQIFWRNQLQQQRTPSVLTLPRGPQELTLRYQSLKEQKRMVDMEKNVEKSLEVLFPHSTLMVNSTPPGAQIFNAADLVGITPTNLLVDPGPVNLEFKLNNFSGILKTNLVENQKLPVTVLLTVGRGKVYVVTDPPGANIFSLDGNVIGKAESLLDLPSGSQTLIARHPQHTNLVEQQFAVLLEAGTIRTNLISFRYGGLIVTSEPTGATLLQNGSAIGLTPYTNGFLQPGPGIYELGLENYQKEGLSAEIVAGQTNRLHKRLTLGTGIVTFTSNPPGAQIFTNGILAGPTPLTSSLPAGTNLVMARFRNWPTQSTNLLARLGKTESAFFYFPHGLLKIESDPPGATISVGKDVIGATPTNLITAIGRLSYELTLPGFSPTNLSVSVAERLGTNLFVKFSKPEFRVETTTAGQIITNSVGMIFVKVRDDLWVGQSKVTIAQYEKISGDPGLRKGQPAKAAEASWTDAMTFCTTLALEEINIGKLPDGLSYSLPKRGEWEDIAKIRGLASAMAAGEAGLNAGGGKPGEWGFTTKGDLKQPAPTMVVTITGTGELKFATGKNLDKDTEGRTFRCVLAPPRDE